jgi:hypothetical protein
VEGIAQVYAREKRGQTPFWLGQRLIDSQPLVQTAPLGLKVEE